MSVVSVEDGLTADQCDLCGVLFLQIGRYFYINPKDIYQAWDDCPACHAALPKVYSDVKYYEPKV